MRDLFRGQSLNNRMPLNSTQQEASCALQVVSVQTEGGMLVTTYRECRRRAQLFALALSRLCVKLGDRVATLAWNNSRHLEAW